MAAAPLIAVFPEYTPAGGSFDAASFHCQANYVQAIKEAGGIPILVPQGLQRQSQEAALGLCDGICLVGGPGLVMGIEGQLPPDLKPVEDRRIASELEALAYCKKRLPDRSEALAQEFCRLDGAWKQQLCFGGS